MDRVVRVTVNSREYCKKEMPIMLISNDSSITMQYQLYKTSLALQPDWVTIKHLNSICDNGLLVVINGEHCSKYMYHIYYQYEDKYVIIKLAVIDHCYSD